MKTLESSFEIKEKIRDAVDIVDLVSRYVPSLQRKGRVYVGRCPWHDDRRPSLQVNPERQTFKCWVCNLGGDIFSFIEQVEGVDFKEALEILADMAGITLPKYTPRRSSAVSDSGVNAGLEILSEPVSDYSPAAEIPKSVLYKSLAWLTEQYHRYFLYSAEAEGARQYIQERGISSEMAERFQIGYAPLRSDTLLDWLGGSRNRVHVLIQAGVLAVSHDSFLPGGTAPLSAGERGSIYDRFRGRVLFPIRDTQDRTVAFGGRILPNSSLNSPAKYINSPETSVFFKSKMFYGLDLARNSIRKKKRVIITEGYTDTIMAHQYGFDETVAVLGTALGAEHVKILNRFADKIYLVLDGDAAGRKRAEEVLGFFVAQGADMSILTLPNNNDPCEFLLAHNAEDFEKQIKQSSVDALEYAFIQATEHTDLSNIIESSRALDHLLSVIALAPQNTRLQRDPAQIRMSRILKRLSERFQVGEKEILSRIKVHRTAQNRSQWDPQTVSGSYRHSSEHEAVVPVPQFNDETPEILASRFGSIPAEIMQTASFQPGTLETEFFTLWWTCPHLFPELASGVSLEDFLSPVSRQIFLLGLDLLNRGISPVTLNAILRRYEHPAMISCLDAVAETGTQKNLAVRLASEKSQRTLLHQVLNGFKSRRIDRANPVQINELRGEKLDNQTKDQKLLDLQKTLNEKQQNRAEQAGLMDEDISGESRD